MAEGTRASGGAGFKLILAILGPVVGAIAAYVLFRQLEQPVWGAIVAPSRADNPAFDVNRKLPFRAGPTAATDAPGFSSNRLLFSLIAPRSNSA